MLVPWKKSYDKLRQYIKKQRHQFTDKGPYCQRFGFPVVMYGCEMQIIKKAEHQRNWFFQTVLLEKTLESPFDCKEIKPVSSKGNEPWIFIGRTDAETPILWPPDTKSHSLGKILMLGKIEGKRRRGKQWMRWLNSITDSTDMNLSKLRETVKDRGPLACSCP